MRDFLAITKALADENRIKALYSLKNGELCVCQIIELLELAPSTVSKHMSILKQARLVETKKRGRWIYYRLPDEDVPEIVAKSIEWIFYVLSDVKSLDRDMDRLEWIKAIDRKLICKCQRLKITVDESLTESENTKCC